MVSEVILRGPAFECCTCGMQNLKSRTKQRGILDCFTWKPPLAVKLLGSLLDRMSRVKAAVRRPISYLYKWIKNNRLKTTAANSFVGYATHSTSIGYHRVKLSSYLDYEMICGGSRMMESPVFYPWIAWLGNEQGAFDSVCAWHSFRLYYCNLYNRHS